ncbi:nickel-dependent lactate racemase [Desulfitobacterium sp. THU1]|uniref:nickel-dependent lactate racemase n=1 Tax=Desulfitobacterium sp. THU1 TaxID=3138072 RepID=UPI00311F90C2
MQIRLPYGTSYLETTIPDDRLAGILTLDNYAPEKDPLALVQDALATPIESPTLQELARKAKKIVVVTSDHTRPLPSKQTLPFILKNIREGNPSAEITILIATGLHRAPTDQEMVDKFGAEIVAQEKFVIHKADDYSTLLRLENLPSGAPFWVNRLAVEADLLLAEGFIEPHFFAGYSGGRKSIMPGISGRETILINHSAGFIDHPKTQSGTIQGNIFHRDMEDAARQAGLKFILNVTLDEEKNIIGAFAGHPEKAFAHGVQFTEKLTKLTSKRAEIVLTSNGGYPLDQNLYQAVKSMRTAEYVAKKGGVIITAASCIDGIGGDTFHRMLLNPGGARAILEDIRATEPTATDLDQWQVQILVRILLDYKVIVVTEGVKPHDLQAMGLDCATTLDEALAKAYDYTHPEADIIVIPNGAGVFVESIE